jgi:CRP-like cAMP-binding protein
MTAKTSDSPSVGGPKPALEFLRTTPFFEGIAAPEIGRIAESAVHKRVPRGGFIFHQGEPAHSAYLITSGLVRLVQSTPAGRNILLRFFFPGDLIGGIAAVRNRVLPASAIAERPTETLSWDRDAMTRLMRAHPRLFQNTLRILEERFHELQDRYLDLATERVEQRLARSLVRLQNQAGEARPDGIAIGIPLSREHLAEMTGTTLYSVSRVLATWERKGLVRVGRLRVTITNPASLAALSESP